MKRISIVTISLILLIFGCKSENLESFNENSMNITSDSSSVSYDGKIYGTVKIGEQWWFKENLDIGELLVRNSINDNQMNNNITEKFCYANDRNNCSIYGSLYQWNEIIQYVSTEGAQGLCPEGWHIPTKEEFEILINGVGGSGNALKAIGQGSGTNTSGFSVLLAGHRDHNDGESHALGSDTIFWTSTESTDNEAYTFELYRNDNIVYSTSYHKDHGFSVRCIKNK